MANTDDMTLAWQWKGLNTFYVDRTHSINLTHSLDEEIGKNGIGATYVPYYTAC